MGLSHVCTSGLLFLTFGAQQPVVPAQADVLASGIWLRAHLDAHTQTEFRVRYVPAPHGGGVWLVRETWAGHPIAGSRMALRVDAVGHLRGVVGRSYPRHRTLPQHRRLGRSFDLWWPTADDLRPVRIEDQPVRVGADGPRAQRHYRDIETGKVLASESRVDEVAAQVAGWREDPLTTPQPLVLELVELDDTEPLALVDNFVRVVHCEFDPEEEKCVPTSFPTVAQGGAFPSDLPPLTDEQAHTDPNDPWAAVAAMNYATRFRKKLDDWGWDADVWDRVTCGEEGIEPEDCHLLLYTNVVNTEGPLDGAYYSHNGTIFMGQATVIDTSYDLGVLVHEIGHHVTNGWGKPEPTAPNLDDSFYRTDYQAINEGTSDIYARWLGLTDEMFAYTRNVGRLYQGPRTRTVAIPFRCPQHVVGESHMEGRIWASAIVELDRALIDAGFADEDTFPSLFLPAMAAIRQIPREQEAQFETAAAIVVDEVGLTLGDDARTLAAELLDERGLLACEHIVDLRSEPNFNPPAGAVPARLVEDARFLILDSYSTSEDDAFVEDNPRAPSVHHQLTLDPDENTLVVRFVPDRWRSRKRDDEPLDQDGLRVAALVRRGAGGLSFSLDPETRVIETNAEYQFESNVDLTSDGTVHSIRMTGLDPGETYSIALVSLSSIPPGFRLLLDHLQWNTLFQNGDEGQTTSEGEAGVGTDDPTSDRESTGAMAMDGEGCGCKQKNGQPRAPWLVVLMLAGWRRRDYFASRRAAK